MDDTGDFDIGGDNLFADDVGLWSGDEAPTERNEHDVPEPLGEGMASPHSEAMPSPHASVSSAHDGRGSPIEDELGTTASYDLSVEERPWEEMHSKKFMEGHHATSRTSIELADDPWVAVKPEMVGDRDAFLPPSQGARRSNGFAGDDDNLAHLKTNGEPIQMPGHGAPQPSRTTNTPKSAHLLLVCWS